MYKDLPEFSFLEAAGSADAICEVAMPTPLKCIDGHFPGQPIVPGAVLLGWVWAAARQYGWQCRPSVTGAKFSHAVIPGDQISFHFHAKPDSLQVRVMHGDLQCARFLLHWQSTPVDD